MSPTFVSVICPIRKTFASQRPPSCHPCDCPSKLWLWPVAIFSSVFLGTMLVSMCHPFFRDLEAKMHCSVREMFLFTFRIKVKQARRTCISCNSNKERKKKKTKTQLSFQSTFCFLNPEFRVDEIGIGCETCASLDVTTFICLEKSNIFRRTCPDKFTPK